MLFNIWDIRYINIKCIIYTYNIDIYLSGLKITVINVKGISISMPGRQAGRPLGRPLRRLTNCRVIYPSITEKLQGNHRAFPGKSIVIIRV